MNWKCFYIGKPIMGIPIYLTVDFLIFTGLWFLIAGIWGTLFLSIMTIVLAHEYFHCIAGRYYGCAVKQIKMTAIGGLAMFERLPANPYHECVVAFAGPLLNIILIPILYLLPYNDFSDTLRYSNLFICLYNLAPLGISDGGRILRCFLMMYYWDRVYCTHLGVKLGQIFSIIIALGIICYTGIPNIVLIAITFFICYMSEQELSHARLQLINRLIRKTKVFTLSNEDFDKMSKDKDFSRRVNRLIAENARLNKIFDFDFSNPYPIIDRFYLFKKNE